MRICAFEALGRKVPGVIDGSQLVDASSLGDHLFDGTLTGSPSDTQKALSSCPRYPYAYEKLRLPIQPTEIWGAGVTYLRSRDARETESGSKGIYDSIYYASRPEIFLKDTGRRTVGPGETIFVRSDSDWTVPEPELAVVLSRDCGVVGYTIANDVSARDIEGQNPLYLPQSKTYRGSCAIGPVVTTKDEITHPDSLTISLKVLRLGKVAFQGVVNASKMKRSIDELISCLKRDNEFFGLTVLMTGTGIVPPDDFSLEEGDTTEIEIEKIGVLRNHVSKLHP